MKIHVSPDYLGYWHAVDEDTYYRAHDDGSMVGHGSTKEAAIKHLKELFKQREEKNDKQKH